MSDQSVWTVVVRPGYGGASWAYTIACSAWKGRITCPVEGSHADALRVAADHLRKLDDNKEVR